MEMCWIAASACGPATRMSPMWLTSKMPTPVRTATCSAMMPEYSTGMSQPLKSTILAPSWRWTTLSAVLRTAGVVSTGDKNEPQSVGGGWAAEQQTEKAITRVRCGSTAYPALGTSQANRQGLVSVLGSFQRASRWRRDAQIFGNVSIDPGGCGHVRGAGRQERGRGHRWTDLHQRSGRARHQLFR